MCKVLIIPRIAESKREVILEFVNHMAHKMSLANSDGLGYAAIDKDGKLFGERWHKNSDFWYEGPKETKNPIPTLFEGALTAYTYQGEDYGSKYVPGEYTRFGVGTLENAVALTLHTRMATSGKEHKNTHPFVYEDQDTSLIHNGVISNTEDFKFKVSTCDSESILISYLDNKVNTITSNVDAMAKQLVGYYVAATFSRDADGNRVLDIMKCHNNNLSVVWVPEFDTYVFSTSHKDLQEVLTYFGHSRVGLSDVKDGVMLRINPFNGNIIEKRSFTEGARTKTYTAPTIPARTSGVQRNFQRNANVVSDLGKHLQKELMDYMLTIPKITTIETAG